MIQLFAPEFELAAFLEGAKAKLKDAGSKAKLKLTTKEEGKDPKGDEKEKGEPAGADGAPADGEK